MKTVVIVQSNYIPWKGYFDLIHRADELILYDDVQFTRRDWRNRNKLKSPSGALWLTIPVVTKGRYFQKICETQISAPGWAAQHWATLAHTYARAPYFKTYRELFERLYRDCQETFLSQVNRRFTTAVMDVLGIDTKISWSSDYRLIAGKTERLVSLCQQAGASTYLSGPSARAYLDEAAFARADISVEYMDYSGYREYPQLYPPFEHAVTVLDLIFSVGPQAPEYMLSFDVRQPPLAGSATEIASHA